MTFHKEGSTSLALCILFIFVLNALIQFYFPQAHAFKWIIYILSFAFFLFVIQYFRNPSVDIVTNEKLVLSPADGKIVAIEEVTETEYLKDKRIRVSISSSPINAHVNRNPIGGAVKYFKHQPAKSVLSLTEPGHTTIAIENSKGATVILRQIGGALSHSIASYIKQGDIATQGAQFGFNKFGSHVEVLLPLGTTVKVAPGDVVTGGHSVLAELKS